MRGGVDACAVHTSRESREMLCRLVGPESVFVFCFTFEVLLVRPHTTFCHTMGSDKNFTTLPNPRAHKPAHCTRRFERTLATIRIDPQIDSNPRVSNLQSSSWTRFEEFRSRLIHSFGASESHKHQTSIFHGRWRPLFFGVRWSTRFCYFSVLRDTFWRFANRFAQIDARVS